MIQLMRGDCLERMKEIPDGSVDAIITDPPYGKMKGVRLGGRKGVQLDGWKGYRTDWDVCIDTDGMLDQCNRVLRTNGALILFAQEPYTSKLITEAHGNLPFSYRMVWLKDDFANYLLANKAPVSYTEDVCVFFKKYDTLARHPLRDYCYNIFKFIGKNKKQIFEEMGHQGTCHFMRYDSMQFGLCTEKTYQELCDRYEISSQPWFVEFNELKEKDDEFKASMARAFNLPDGKKFKSNVLEYRKDYTGLHPTQKPVALMEDLIRTYTHEGETVLDFAFGSLTTGVACANLNRNFIGIEKDLDYFNVGVNRLKEHIRCLNLKIELEIDTGG